MLLQCSNDICGEGVVCSGAWGYEYGEMKEEEEEGGYFPAVIAAFIPEYFVPALDIFQIPQGCPPRASDEIRLSFRIYFADPSSAANHVRKAIENLLTAKGIKRFVTEKSGKRKIVSLHDRIVQYRIRDAENADLLMAIKWLGNAGSHDAELTKEDVLDSYELLEVVLDNLYVKHAKKVRQLAKSVNKRKGPMRRL